MALFNCEECGREVSSRAAACPHCGCPVTNAEESAVGKEEQTTVQPVIPASWTASSTEQRGETPPQSKSSSTRVLFWLGLLAIVIILIRGCSGDDTGATNVDEAAQSEASAAVATTAPPAPVPPPGPSEADAARWATQLNSETESVFVRERAARQLIENFPDSEAGKKAAASIAELNKAVAYEKSGAQWTYHTSTEGMSDKNIRTARVRSENTINLGFPYGGPQHATLAFRRHPRWGNDVFLSIEQGQILCHSYGDCYIGVRFDDGQLLRYKGNPPEDNSTEVVFIPAFSTFMKKLPNSKRVRVEIQLYQAGNHVLEFDVSGFKPEKFK